jgi:TonB-linked SusC/RagA family outer membrane protein
MMLKKLNLFHYVLLFSFLLYGKTYAQQIVKGTVKDEKGETLVGVSVKEQATTNGVQTDLNGDFSIRTTKSNATLIFTYISFETKSVNVVNNQHLTIVLKSSTKDLEEVVVVGYGVQDKKSVVGSVVSVKGDVLDRTGGMTNFAQALTGNLPGVTTLQLSGEPGSDETNILIRGQSTWNNSKPLVLVDGIERPLTDIDVKEVESVSVLKDASATAVYGVKGANGVILITTKRGKSGKTQLSATYSQGFKTLSKLPTTLNSFDAITAANQGIENELPSYGATAWAAYVPYEIARNYADPNADRYRYPDVNWQKEILKDVAYSNIVNVNASGGNDFVKYFGSLGYNHDGDLYKTDYNEQFGYTPGFGYDRYNFRSNLDFTLSKTTTLGVNLSGYVGSKKSYNANGLGGDSFADGAILMGIYKKAPDMYAVRYPDGLYGYTPIESKDRNPVDFLNNQGITFNTRKQLATDLNLQQKLDVITKGLTGGIRFSYDSYFNTLGRSLKTPSLQYEYIDPITGIVTLSPNSGSNDYDFILGDVVVGAESYDTSSKSDLRKNLYYEANLNYQRGFNNNTNNVSALFLFNRREYNVKTNFPDLQESWAGRVTYNYKYKYLLEANGAYNGTNSFGVENRFSFFPSISAGYNIKQEEFMKNIDWLSRLKLRYSYGIVGSDAGIKKFGYNTTWQTGGDLALGDPNLVNSPYIQYTVRTTGNPSLRWETAKKQNYALETSFFNEAINFTAEYFTEHRKDIFISEANRNVAVFTTAVDANLGKTETRGFELSLDANHKLSNDFKIWANLNFTRAVDKVIYREDPELLSAYQKNTGYQIGQTKTQIQSGFINNWDDMYAATQLESSFGNLRLPGDLAIIDFNGDGVINGKDNAPYGYPNNRPQNNYSLTVGFDTRGISFMVQFYGVSNVSKSFQLPTASGGYHLFYQDYGNVWTPQNLNADYTQQRFTSVSTIGAYPSGLMYLYDASYLKLQTAEIAYTFKEVAIKRLGLSGLKVYLQGNNLFYWSDLPLDAEGGGANLIDGNQGIGKYPLFKKFNLGLTARF